MHIKIWYLPSTAEIVVVALGGEIEKNEKEKYCIDCKLKYLTEFLISVIFKSEFKNTKE